MRDRVFRGSLRSLWKNPNRIHCIRYARQRIDARESGRRDDGSRTGSKSGVGVRSADVGQARVLASLALTQIQVVWISVWISSSVCCCTFEVLRSERDVCARTQKTETIEPVIIRSTCLEKIVTPLLQRRIDATVVHATAKWAENFLRFSIHLWRLS